MASFGRDSNRCSLPSEYGDDKLAPIVNRASVVYSDCHADDKSALVINGTGSAKTPFLRRTSAGKGADAPDKDRVVHYLSKEYLMGPVVSYVSVFVDYFGLGILVPLLPFFVEDDGASPIWVGIILSVQYAGVVVGNQLGGFLSDRLGRKRTLLLAMAGDAVFFGASAFAPNVLYLTAFRFFAGMFTPLAPSLTWLMDSVEPHSHAEATGIWSTFASVAFILASAVGGLLGNWMIAMVLTAFLSLLSALHIFFAPPPGSLIPDSKIGTQEEAPPAPPANLTRLLWSHEFIALSIMSVGSGMLFGVIFALIPIVVIDNYEYAEVDIALMMAGLSLANVIAIKAGFAGMVKRLGHPTNLAVVTSLLNSALLLTTAFVLEIEIAFLALCVFQMVSMCIQVPTCTLMAADFASKYASNARGTSIGTTRAFFSVGQAIGPLLSVWLYETSTALPYYVVAAYMALTGIHNLYTYRAGRDLTYEDADAAVKDEPMVATPDPDIRSSIGSSSGLGV
jgi:MFS family permease